jgi:murein DD-endopeptidase MepM/ murein hydrolase activator NlpD
MKKHQVNRGPVPGRAGRSTNKIPQISALGLAVAAAMAMSGAPGLGLSANQIAPQPVQAPNYEAAAYVQPVRVSLLSGVDAIAWQTLGITSSAAGIGSDGEPAGAMPAFQAHSGSGLGAATQANAAGILVGQNVGVLGALPGNIQLMHPVASRHITSPFGFRHNPTGPGTQIHIGQDYAVPCGSPVYASADGVVIQSAWAGHSGMRVTIDHGSSVRTGYSHNSRLVAKVGDVVKQGQLIALSGTTGNSTGCHVHFEVIINGRWNDPRNFLPPISGQPNPMIDSRRTTIAAEPIRNTGAPRASEGGAGDFPTRWASAPHAHNPSPAPARHRAPAVAPKAEPPATHKPEAKPKPAPQVKPRPDTKPAPTTQAPAPQVKPKPETTPSPTTQTPAPQPKPTPAPTTPAPTTPAPTTPAPETTNPLPEVNEVPTLEIPLPETETDEPSSGPTDGATAPKADDAAPQVESEPKTSTPKDDGTTPDSAEIEPAKKESDQEAPAVQKAPAVEQPPVKLAEESEAKTVSAPAPQKAEAPAPVKKVAAPAPVKKAAAPAPKPVAAPKAPVEAIKAAPVAKPKPVAPKAPVAPVKKAAAPAPAPAKAEVVKPKAPKPVAKPAAESTADAPADTGGEAAADK